MAHGIYHTIKRKISGMDVFEICLIFSIVLHGTICGAYYISTRPSSSGNADVYDARNMSFKDVDVDFIDLPPTVIMGGSTNPAPVEKSEWVEGTGDEDKPDAENTDVNINKLSGDGTDADGYMYAELADHTPIPIVDFDPNDYFPDEARSANITTKTVVLRFQVDEDGSIKSSRIVSKPSGYGFDEAAMKVAGKLRFRPGRVNRKAVKMLVDLPIRFEQVD